PVKRHDWGHPVRVDGTLRSHYHRYPRLSRALAAYGDALTLARPETVTAIGFLLDDFMTEVNLPPTQQATDILTHQREVILFDFIARGLALTHRPFDAVELGQADLDPARYPSLWTMLELSCPASVQQKLVEYVRAGGRLAVVGRLDAAGPLARALRLHHIASDPPFTPRAINAFGYRDIPASFVQICNGDFDEVFATCDGAPVGFTVAVGQGLVMALTAAFPANTLVDLDVLAHMARRLGCPAPFTLSCWADVSLSRGPAGDFLFINHYDDDPLETAIAYRGEPLFGGHPLCLPARSGAILPLNWQLRPDVTVHYATAEVAAVRAEGSDLILTFAQPRFHAGLTVAGSRFSCRGDDGILRFSCAS
ncbi:MAG: glycoside hydrolase, partial [Anaerolineae bacterium]|nr:glycoside hydrolase [Anaerolineae bacterium]